MTTCPSDVAQRFVGDIAEHELTIVRDDGLYRHLRFAKPGTRAMSFDILTWPGHLCYTGDMGTYVFSRVRDMFDFFRGERINPGYWAEKVLASDKSDGITTWSPEIFRARALEALSDWVDGDVSDELRKDFEYSVLLGHDWHSAETAYTRMMEFEWEGECPFSEFYEVDTNEFSFRYTWCCYALVWGIQQYEKATATP